MDDYKYITDYRGYAIHQDMETGYFYASDDRDDIVACDATQKMIRLDIDNLLS